MISDRLNLLASSPSSDPAELWDAARSYVRYVVSRFVPAQALDDVAQDAVLAIIRSELPVNGAVVFSIARTTALKFLRDRRLSVSIAALDEEDVSSTTEDLISANTAAVSEAATADLLERETLERQVQTIRSADRSALSRRDLAIRDTLDAGVPAAAFRKEHAAPRTKSWGASSAASLRPGPRLMHAYASGSSVARELMEAWRRPSHPVVLVARGEGE